MVLAILVETTSPIRVLRRPGVFAVLVAAVVSAMAYFFSVAAFLLAAFFAVTVFFTGLLALAAAPGWITDRQIEASRVAMTRFVKRGGKIWIRLFPDKPVTKKPAETRMGKGKGAPDHWVAVVRPGKILFEMEGVSVADAAEAMRLASHKLPLRTKFVQREGVH